MAIQTKCDEFLTKYGMHHNTLDLAQETQTYLEEMQAGLAGEPSTLMMLPTFISVGDEVPMDTPIVVIDAGGTNFRVAVVTFRSDQSPLIEDFTMYKMPGTEGTIGKEEFFDIIAERLLPVIHRSPRVGFCFSYPTTILPNKDGEFIDFSKEVSVEGMEGAILGEEINKSLAKHGVEPREFLVLNDTVAAMLGGMGGNNGDNYDGYIGFILGTGINTCYIEKSENITKDENAMAQGGYMAINVETGGYGKFPRGVIDETFDGDTANPGAYTFEKMVSGAYQGGVLYLTVEQAIKDGLFSDAMAEVFPAEVAAIPLWEVDQFLADPTGDNPLAEITTDADDRELLIALFTASYERAAKLVTVCLGATAQEMERGNDPQRPICVVAEGTTFDKSEVFRQKLDIHVKEFLNDTLGVYVEFRKVEDATLLGTAVAGLIG